MENSTNICRVPNNVCNKHKDKHAPLSIFFAFLQ